MKLVIKAITLFLSCAGTNVVLAGMAVNGTQPARATGMTSKLPGKLFVNVARLAETTATNDTKEEPHAELTTFLDRSGRLQVQGDEIRYSASLGSNYFGNWIAVYEVGQGPRSDGEVRRDYKAWDEAPYALGNTCIQFLRGYESLVAGAKYQAYFMEDGYRWLAQPVQFTVPENLSGRLQGLDDSIKYRTISPRRSNWIAVYEVGQGPRSDGEVRKDYKAWGEAPYALGSAPIQFFRGYRYLVAGAKYQAYFMEDNGYRWLAQPVQFTVPTWLPGRLESDGFEVKYETTEDAESNWIAIYDFRAEVPRISGEQSNAEKAGWSFAPGTSGTINLQNFRNASLVVGQRYMFYFLAKQGYKWLARPASLDISLPGTLTVHQPRTFKYSTSRPRDGNWIAFYENGQGPQLGRGPLQEHKAWSYAPKSDGFIDISQIEGWKQNLERGKKYDVYYLQEKTHIMLAEKVAFNMPKFGFS